MIRLGADFYEWADEATAPLLRDVLSFNFSFFDFRDFAILYFGFLYFWLWPSFDFHPHFSVPSAAPSWQSFLAHCWFLDPPLMMIMIWVSNGSLKKFWQKSSQGLKFWKQRKSINKHILDVQKIAFSLGLTKYHLDHSTLLMMLIVSCLFSTDLRDIVIQALAAFVCYPDSLKAVERMDGDL